MANSRLEKIGTIYSRCVVSESAVDSLITEWFSFQSYWPPANWGHEERGQTPLVRSLRSVSAQTRAQI
jgi:hypothetical protein